MAALAGDELEVVAGISQGGDQLLVSQRPVAGEDIQIVVVILQLDADRFGFHFAD
jgi:hypothetical protein